MRATARTDRYYHAPPLGGQFPDQGKGYLWACGLFKDMIEMSL